MLSIMAESRSSLTEEQRCRIEENRRKALERRAAKQLQLSAVASTKNGVQTATKQSILSQFITPNKYAQNTAGAKTIQLLPSAVSSVKSQQSLSGSNKNSLFWFTNEVKDSVPSKNTAVNKPVSQVSNSNKLYSKAYIQGTCIVISLQRFYVDVGYHQQMIEIFRSIPSRMYDAKERKWNFAFEDHDRLINALKVLHPDVIISPLPKYVIQIFMKASTAKEFPQVDLTNLDPKLQDALLPFQREGVSFGIQHGGRLLIADDMGLGKTIQAIAIADFYSKEWPLLVVAPSSVRYSWTEAFHTWLPSLDPQEIIVINTSKENVSSGKVVILSYDLLNKKINDIVSRKFKVIILDESHFIKNQKSARTRAAQSAIKYASRVILLTGTPALSRPIELYTQICAVKPKSFPSYVDFGIRYCNGKQMPWGWDFSGSSNMSELQILLEETIMIRRLKSDVLKQLPAKVRQTVILDPSTVNTKNKVLKAMSREMSKENLRGLERRGVLLKYFQETAISKLSAICDYIKDLLESDRKFLCFGHHLLVLDGICNTLEQMKCGYMRIDGSTPSEQRKVLCDKFQFNDNCRVAVLSITAANSGITLTAAQLVVFAELFWNPGILTQAEDRAHRIGQQDSVLVQYLVAQGTADDIIWPLIQHKLNILNQAGLSKETALNCDTVMARNTSQPSIEKFLMDLSEDENFWNEHNLNNIELDQPEVKRCKF